MENSHKEINLLCMNFKKVEYIFVGSTWKKYKNFPIDGANAFIIELSRFPPFAATLSSLVLCNVAISFN